MTRPRADADHAMAVAVGGRIAAYRAAASLSPKAFADRIGTSETNVRRWERGETLPHGVHLVAIAKTIGTDVDALLDVPAEPAALPPTGTGAA